MVSKKKHPLEDVFDIESGSTSDEQYDIIETQAFPPPVVEQSAPVQKDEDDTVIDKRFDAIYDAAVQAYENQTAFTEIVDPKFAARNAEVSANFLTIALAAVNSKARAKSDRQRTAAAVKAPPAGSTTNNILVANREEILRMIADGRDKSKPE
jgi:hypothetical protein